MITTIAGGACQWHEQGQLHTVPLMVKNHLDGEMQCFEELDLIFRPHDRLLLFIHVQVMLDGELLPDMDLIS